jgi:NADH-quinone oxidoreductase subunit G
MPEVKMATVTIDGVKVEVPAGTLLVEAAKQVQKDIPIYCYHTKLGPAGLCRICLVEIEGMPKLQIACNTAVTDGMVVNTAGDKATEGRRAVLESAISKIIRWPTAKARRASPIRRRSSRKPSI